jgi:hypothetical protein
MLQEPRRKQQRLEADRVLSREESEFQESAGHSDSGSSGSYIEDQQEQNQKLELSESEDAVPRRKLRGRRVPNSKTFEEEPPKLRVIPRSRRGLRNPIVEEVDSGYATTLPIHSKSRRKRKGSADESIGLVLGTNHGKTQQKWLAKQLNETS